MKKILIPLLPIAALTTITAPILLTSCNNKDNKLTKASLSAGSYEELLEKAYDLNFVKSYISKKTPHDYTFSGDNDASEELMIKQLNKELWAGDMMIMLFFLTLDSINHLIENDIITPDSITNINFSVSKEENNFFTFSVVGAAEVGGAPFEFYFKTAQGEACHLNNIKNNKFNFSALDEESEIFEDNLEGSESTDSIASFNLSDNLLNEIFSGFIFPDNSK